VSVTYVPAALRRAVMARAHHVCEYCLLDEEDTFFGLEVDHIIAEKHGGETTSENLACACLTCNRNKGSDIASLEPGTRNVMRLYRPHEDRWDEHFRLEGSLIQPVTLIGTVTVQLLRLNSSERLLEREVLARIGRYLSKRALEHIQS
jgi:hypothetical protein